MVVMVMVMGEKGDGGETELAVRIGVLQAYRD